LQSDCSVEINCGLSTRRLAWGEKIILKPMSPPFCGLHPAKPLNWRPQSRLVQPIKRIAADAIRPEKVVAGDHHPAR
jgi:hypothetical protein